MCIQIAYLDSYYNIKKKLKENTIGRKEKEEEEKKLST